MKNRTILFFIALLVVCISAKISKNKIYHRASAPSNWILNHRALQDQPVTFTLALKQRNVEVLERLVLQHADPRDPTYSQHLTREEVMALIAPPKEVQHKIIKWVLGSASRFGSQVTMKNNQDAIQFTGPARWVEQLFETELYVFTHSEHGARVVKHLGHISLPQSLADHIELVTGITEFPSYQFLEWKNKRAEASPDNQCNVPVTMKQLYNIPQDLVVSNENANQSIYSQMSPNTTEGFGVSSLADWEEANDLPENPVACVLGPDVNWYVRNDTDGEAQLDTQMMGGMAPGASTCFYVMGSDSWMFEFAQEIFNADNSTLVTSISYGAPEFMECNITDCQSLHILNSQDYVLRTNVEWAKLGAIGHTVVVASGDDGTAGGHGSDTDCTQLEALYPASSPWVLAVGATSVEPSDNAVTSVKLPPICTDSFYQCNCSTSSNEQPASQNNAAGFDTGGGFSTYAKALPFQQAAVQNYLKSGVAFPDSSLWNSNNRGYPDIAAVGGNVCVLDPQTPCSLTGGTSASAPIIASLITLLNQDRLNANKKPLGFVNPLIYQLLAMDQQKYFTSDMTSGNNGGECGSDHGFNAAPGWDALTGAGSPNFGNIRQYVATLP